MDAGFIIAGAVTGLVVGLTGVGGGALMTPILLIVFGISPVTAVATDLWFAAITKIAAVFVHRRGGNVDWQIVRRLWAGSLPVSLATVVSVTAGMRIGKLDWLTTAIGILVAVAAIGLLFAPTLRESARISRIADPARFKARQPALTVAAGGLLGLLVSLTSVGAGALGSVMLVALYPLRMTPHKLVATDIAHAIPLAIFAGTGYLIAGQVDWSMLLALLIGSVPAVLVGSVAAQRFSATWLRIALALVLLASAAKVIAS
ncbi:MAG: sulfite exporter TauE/SafE family protein [Planctomycetes bacterium]|nr:sulfite exporter TauE/SafE family protein [Planctomycetota bacterium]